MINCVCKLLAFPIYFTNLCGLFITWKHIVIWWKLYGITVTSHKSHGSQIVDRATVSSTACSGWQQRKYLSSWWRHQMEIFSALLVICAGNSPVPGEFPAPVTWSFEVFFDLRLNNRFSKQSWGWWFETLSHPLWRHCNVRVLALCTDNHCGWRMAFAKR